MTENKRRILILNKKDLAPAFEMDGAVSISALNKDLGGLSEALGHLFTSDQIVWQPRLSNERQLGLLSQARQDMDRAREAMENGIEPDLIEIDLLSAHDHLKEILGEVHREDLLDTLFTNFCLGK